MSKVIDAANAQAIARIQQSRIFLTGVSKAREKLPFLNGGKALTHSGPPVRWENMCAAMRGAACGAVVYEGWTETLAQAEALLNSGEVRFYCNNENACVSPMAGIISPSMPVYVFENRTYGNCAYSTFNEGLGKALRFGANDDIVLARLKWIERVLGPMVGKAVELMGGELDITSLLTRGVQRGDEAHNRNKACTSLFIRTIAPWLVRTDADREDVAQALAFFNGNDHSFLNLSMGNSKATMDSIAGLEDSTIVSCMCNNGVEFGVRVAGAGETWFKAPSPYADGNYFKGFSRADASTTMGDSVISEAAGLGGFAMGAAPGIGQFIGISAQQTMDYSLRMYEIVDAEHALFKIPALNFRGTPVGIDIRKVLKTGILPVMNTGIAHVDPGVGQIGAGVYHVPRSIFEQAADFMGLKS